MQPPVIVWLFCLSSTSRYTWYEQMMHYSSSCDWLDSGFPFLSTVRNPSNETSIRLGLGKGGISSEERSIFTVFSDSTLSICKSYPNLLPPKKKKLVDQLLNVFLWLCFLFPSLIPASDPPNLNRIYLPSLVSRSHPAHQSGYSRCPEWNPSCRTSRSKSCHPGNPRGPLPNYQWHRWRLCRDHPCRHPKGHTHHWGNHHRVTKR